MVTHILLWVGLAVLQSSAEAKSCTAKLGEAFDFRDCTKIDLGELEIEYLGAERPDPRVALICDTYRVQSASERTTFSTCSTGALGGGEARFSLWGSEYVVDRDVPSRCVRGRWVLGLRVWRYGPETLPLAQRTEDVWRVLKRGLTCDGD